MYHYLFTNDLRISRLNEALVEAGKCFVTDTVPSATEDKNANNNMNTLGFYFNLTNTSHCALAASEGNIRKVVLNFIKKFQFPNPRTSASMNEVISDGITIAPMRVIVQTLYIMRMINPSKAFLSTKEIADFIFFNDNIAKTENPDIAGLATTIINMRKSGESGEIPDDNTLQRNGCYWNQCRRQIREMVKILCWTGCIVEQDDGCIRISHNNLSRENEADLFEIITFTGLWKPALGIGYNDNKVAYQNYMDIELLLEKDNGEESVNIMDDIVFETGYSSSYKRNRIIFGAPGTGKSFTVNKEKEVLLKDNGEFERVTFHPDYSYANFVGTYKPVMISPTHEGIPTQEKQIVVDALKDTTKTAQEKYDLLYDKFKDDALTLLPILLGLYTDEKFKTRKQDGTEVVEDDCVERNHGKAIRPYVELLTVSSVGKEIAYQYVPGPFMRILVKALKNAMTNSTKPHLLLIEEINRANVAAVFGDIFQLLDRDNKNISEYEITTSNDMRTYLAQELNVDESKVETIKIPDNMFIWATMNSADQGVFPMDTAFKRRWDFSYLGIDDAVEKMSDTIKNKKYTLGSGANARLVNWNDLRSAINDVLSSESYNINEDKLLGPYFISKTILESEDEEEFIKVFKNKVLMYLFEDAVKQKKKTFFEKCKDEVKGVRYSDLCNQFDTKGVFIFPDEVSKRFTEKPTPEEVMGENEE